MRVWCGVGPAVGLSALIPLVGSPVQEGTSAAQELKPGGLREPAEATLQGAGLSLTLLGTLSSVSLV